MELKPTRLDWVQQFLHLNFEWVAGQSIHQTLDEDARLVLIKSLWELGRDEEAKRHLEELQGTVSKTSDAFLLVLAQWSARQNDKSKAERLFQLLLDRSQAAESFVQAKMGLCQLAMAEQNRAAAEAHLQEVNELYDVVGLEVQVQIQLLRAEFALVIANDPSVLRLHALKAQRLATQLGSLYHLSLSLILLVRHASQTQNAEAAKLYNELLDGLLPEAAMALRQKASDVQVETDGQVSKPTLIKFDVERKRVAFNDHWIAFHEKPILFSFLEFLHRRQHFVGKKEIAEFLWPEQPYKARIHDPRLFDIARRLRGIMEECPGNRLSLLSGRLGYLLVQDQATTAKAAHVAVSEPENFSKDLW